MSERGTAFHCPECGSTSVRRSRRANATEMFRMMLGVYPFRCTACGARFWSNVWLFNSWRWAKCPRCLNLNLSDWPERHYRVTAWTQFLTVIGGKKHRCSPCRCNFVSFRPRLTQYQFLEEDDEEEILEEHDPHEPKPGESTETEHAS